MRRVALVVLLVACRSPEQTPAPAPSASVTIAEPSATTTISASAAASVEPSAIADAGKPHVLDEDKRRALAAKAEELQKQMMESLAKNHPKTFDPDEAERGAHDMADLLTAQGASGVTSYDAGRRGGGGLAGLGDLGSRDH